MTQIAAQQMTCARIPTQHGEFQLCLYRSSQEQNKEHLAFIMGDVSDKSNVLVRVHSECFTGDVLGSLRCDCGPQLNRAMQHIAAEGQGIILYLRQEGRGIGLLEKLKAYNLQDVGYDTVDANLMLGHDADARDYTIAALILQDLGVQSIRLMTNNPRKITSMRELGIDVTSRMPLELPANAENIAYLTTKVQRMHHLLNLEANYPDVLNLIAHSEPDRQRPFVTLSYAQSLDGSIAMRRGQSMTISSPESYTLTHQLRASHDAILVGIGTVLADDPRLDVRLVDGPDPQPIVLDSHLRFPLDAQLLQREGHLPWIVTTNEASEDRQRELEAAGAKVWRVTAVGNPVGNHIDLQAMLTLLAEQNIRSLMVEGGARIITNFLAAKLVDRLVLTIAPMLVGGLHAVNFNGTSNGQVLLPRLDNAQYQQSGRDMVLTGNMVWD